MQDFKKNPYATIQTCYWLASSLSFLRACEVFEVCSNAVLGNALRGAERACAVLPWLPREQATLKNGSNIWIGPVLSGRELAAYYGTLPDETLKERFHRDCVAPEIKMMAGKLDSGLIHVIGAYDNRNKLVGVAEAVPLRDPTKVEANFSVHPDYQGLGLSGYLVDACLRQCAASGYNTVIAEVETSQKSVRLAKFFPREDRITDGRNIALFLHFDKHPEIFQNFLAQARVLQQGRLMGSVPVPAAVRDAVLMPGRMAAALIRT